MLQRFTTILVLSILSFSATSFSQDKGEIKVYKNEFLEKIKKSAEEYNEKKEEPKKVFRMDFSGYERFPVPIDQKQPAVRKRNSGTLS